VDGARLHYIDRGQGRSVAFIHGNGAMVEDFLISTVIERTARSYRAVAIDRPGFGHSERPNGRRWTATAQASLLLQAIRALGLDRPIIVGHSWGTLVALAMALDHPRHVSGLVLVSGYYFPTPRTDALLFSPPAIPFLGKVLSHTLAPIIGEAVAPRLMTKAFAPQGIPPRFRREFPVALTLRPAQIRAFSEDASHMVGAAQGLCARYPAIFPPTAILAGDADQIVDFRQAQRLHGELPGSQLEILRGGCHMVHHIAPERIVRAIDTIAEESPALRAAP
jgi:pimeloyl-ACP methyl ester carboxylesterase